MHDWQSELLPGKGILRPVLNPIIEHWSHLRCGSYTAEWVSLVLGIQNTPSNFLLKGPIWFDVFRPIVPSDMQKICMSKGMSTIQINLKDKTREERLTWIKEQLANKKTPPILLVRTKALHWIAIGGYNDASRVFYIYDPNIGNDSTSEKLPIGNSYILYDDLMFIWKGRWKFQYRVLLVTDINTRMSHTDRIDDMFEAVAQNQA